MSRSQYHQQHAARAEAEARHLLQQREALGPRWLDWVAGQLYQLSPAEYAGMVRRQLEQLRNS